MISLGVTLLCWRLCTTVHPLQAPCLSTRASSRSSSDLIYWPHVCLVYLDSCSFIWGVVVKCGSICVETFLQFFSFFVPFWTWWWYIFALYFRRLVVILDTGSVSLHGHASYTYTTFLEFPSLTCENVYAHVLSVYRIRVRRITGNRFNSAKIS